MEDYNGLEIAVIGMSGMFPGATNISEFWKNIINKVESIEFLSDEELKSIPHIEKLSKNPNYVNSKGGVLNEKKYFDPLFFDYTYKEGELMNPQTRLMHQIVWSAIENAGYIPDDYKGMIGLYVGSSSSFYDEAQIYLGGKNKEFGNFYSFQLVDKDFMATRLAYSLNLRGPSITVQTACSTSLVAIHLATQAILNGECNIAVAGGITIHSQPMHGYIYENNLVASKDGHCRPFDKDASGTIHGEGGGVVVLKALSDAIEDRDHIYAVIKGTAINNDGNRKVGYTAPSLEGQTNAIKMAHLVGDVNPETITYIEAHGTGTRIGDPIEIKALSNAFETDKRQFCAISSVKSNIGHLDTAAGVSGFIKASLALHNKQIPPCTNYNEPNPEIDFANTPFYVNNKVSDWENEKFPRRVGVSSFGIGGTNAHAVLEESPGITYNNDSRRYKIISTSAKSEKALKANTNNLLDYFNNNSSTGLADAAFTLHKGRKAFNYRFSCVCSSLENATEVITEKSKQKNSFKKTYSIQPKVYFLFSGLGAQYVNMGRDLYFNEPEIKLELDNCFDIIYNQEKIELKKILFPESNEPSENFNDILISQLTVFCIEYSIAKALIKWGIKPEGMIGYSFGEYVAACISGLFGLEDIIKIIVNRAKLLKLSEEGAMMSIPLPINKVRTLINKDISIAIDNGLSCIVAGEKNRILDFKDQLRKEKILCFLLQTDKAIHSSIMDPIHDDFIDIFKTVKFGTLNIPFISNVTGDWVKNDQVSAPAYWGKHLKNMVEFDKGIKNIISDENAVYIEIGAGNNIASLISRLLNNQKHKAINLIRPEKTDLHDDYYFLNKISQLWTLGITINWDEYYSNEIRYKVPLPSYSFDKEEYVFESEIDSKRVGDLQNEGQILKKNTIQESIYKPTWKLSQLDLNEQVEKNDEVWLLFLSENEIQNSIRKKIEQNCKYLFTAEKGSKFKFKNNKITFDPTAEKHYELLINKIYSATNKIPKYIIYTVGISNDTKFINLDNANVENSNQGYFSMVYLIKSIGKYKDTNSIKISIVGNRYQKVYNQDLINPFQSTVLGPVKVIPKEYSHVKCKLIDIDLPKENITIESFVDTLYDEFTSNDEQEIVAYRGGNRFIKVYDRINKTNSKKITLRKNGIYIIIGGLGGIGYLIAETLLQKYQAKVIIIGRTKLPEEKDWEDILTDDSDTYPRDIKEKITKIYQLATSNEGVVEYYSTDISEENNCKNTFDAIKNKYSNINGIINSAAIADGTLCQFQDKDKSERIFNSKINGTINITKSVQGINLDFFLLFSSLDSLFGGLGHVAYCAANNFLDAFAEFHRSTNNLNIISINWDRWENTGIASNENHTLSENQQQMLIGGLSQEDGINCFLNLPFNNYSQIAISTIDIDYLISQLNSFNINNIDFDQIDLENAPIKQRSVLNKYVPPTNEIEKKIVEIWKKILGYDEIGITDNFFELGGDSLKGIFVINKTNAELNSNIRLDQFFPNPTIKNLTNYVSDKEVKNQFTIRKVEEKEYYPLSSSQKRFFYVHNLDKENISYNENILLKITGEINKNELESGFKTIIERHKIFRTSIQIFNEEPVQRVFDKVNFSIEYVDDITTDINQLIRSKIRPFDLNSCPLFKVVLFKLNPNEHILLIDFHHIIIDGISIGVFLNELFSLLNNISLKIVENQYVDYLLWEDSKKEIEESKEYWLNEFKDEIPIVDVPTDYYRKTNKTKNGATLSLEISKQFQDELNLVSQTQGVTLFTLFISTFNILLSKLSNQKDIVVGTPVANRSHRSLEKIIGPLLNILAIKTEVDNEISFKDYLKNINEKTQQAYKHQSYKFEELVNDLDVEREAGRNPIFEFMFVFNNMDMIPASLKEQENDIKIEPYFIDDITSQFDLTLKVNESQEGLIITLNYSTDLFKEITIKRFLKYFKRLLHQLPEKVQEKLSNFEIITEPEKHQLLHEFNNTKADYQNDKTIYKLFEEQVIKTPNNIAVSTKDKSLNYKELHAKAEKLAKILRSNGISSGDVVSLMLDRSIEMIIGLMGILKAGCCYLPVLPSTPKSRLNYILDDSESSIILTQTKYAESLVERVKGINLEELDSLSCSLENLAEQNNPNSLAYIIYTSGTTGNPKGVMIENHSVVNRIKWMQKNYPIGEGDTILQKTPYTFDVSVWELFWWSFEGASVYMLEPEGEKDPQLISRTIEEKKINAMHFVPSMLEAFLNVMELDSKKSNWGSMKYVFSSGEALKPNHVYSFYKLFKDNVLTKLVNLYGPTEATVDVSYFDCLRDVNYNKIPIGKPIDNTQLYILDKNTLQVQGIGIIGELMISGVGLSRGYLKKDELTKEKFIDHPYKEGERLYRTGDLARWLPDGNIEFHGRIDHQVKIRGFRIELGEIENVLQKHENIKECVVLVREENGEKYLCAYLVTGADINEEEIRTYLSVSLLDYMVPSYFVQLEKLPLTSNGKVNRKALPSPEVKAGDDYVAPSNATEEKLVEIWSEVLNIEKEEISTTANFFNIGGHSLKATVLTGRILKETGVEFLLGDVFIHTSIRAQANKIEKSSKKEFVSIPKVKDQEYYALSSAQKRLYLLQQMDLESTAYNMPYTIPLEADFTKEKIEQVFHQLLVQHESFRTSFEIINEEPVQRINQQVEFNLEEITLTEEEAQEKREQFIQAFDLSKAPLLRAVKINVIGGSNQLIIDMHHIISDGVSHTILEKDFQTLYSGKDLAPLSLQYKDYSEWQNKEEQQLKVKEQGNYWINKFEGEIPVLDLPADYARPVVKSHEGATVNFALNREGTRQIKLLVRENGLTLYMAILSVFKILLSKLSGQEEIIIGMPIAGRNHSDLENIVGLFVNTLAIRNKVNGKTTLKEFTKELKQTTLEAFENQDYQFEDLVENIQVERDISRNPIFDVIFNLLNQTEYSGDLSEFNNDSYVHIPGISKFDLTLTAIDYGEQLMLSFEYCTKLFKAETIERFIRYFKEVINQIPLDLERKISEIEIISEEEKRQLLYSFNDTKVPYPSHKSIPEVFKEQVNVYSKKIALEDNNKPYTYQELDIESNKVANYLAEKGVAAGQLVGLMAGRSSGMIISILGILKTGGAYVPIDPAYPEERINQLIKDSGIKLLLSTEQVDFECSLPGGIIQISDKVLQKSSTDFSLPSMTSGNIAYVMYTSGSTGTPKGVVIEQKSVLRLVQNNRFFPFNLEQKILLTGAPVFDATTFEIWGALLNGGSLYIASNEVIINAELLGEYIRNNSITCLWLTSSLFNQLTDQDESIFDTLNFLLVGGDVLSVKHINKIRRRNTDLIIINGYGPTENTTFSTTFNIEREYEGCIPIGKPISNSTAYIFDKNNKLQTMGVPGELLVGGDGLAREYLNNPELTREKFIENPYKPGERLYRTGDLARWLHDGNIEFLGRIDHQVKIRGFRIELGEIENAIQKHEKIKESLVLTREENGEKYLCAYLVAGEDFILEELRTYLSSRLPDYMIPLYFVKLEKIPLTTNGKVNQKALPSPEVKAGGDYVAPSNETEEKLVEIWSEVLKIAKEEISVTANFFSIGGHSLKAMLMVNMINKVFNIKYSLIEVYKEPTIARIATVLNNYHVSHNKESDLEYEDFLV